MTLNEITQLYQIRRLAKEEVVRSFDCGDEDLNDFILNESVRYRQARLAVSYVIEIKGLMMWLDFSVLQMIGSQFQILKARLSSTVSVRKGLLMKNDLKVIRQLKSVDLV